MGNAAVVAGTLTGVPLLVDLGALLLVIGLAIALRMLRRLKPSAVEADALSRSAGLGLHGSAAVAFGQHPSVWP